MILKNEKLTVEIDEQTGGDVLQLACAGKNFLDKRGIQAWIKAGERVDPATNVLGNFYGNIRNQSFTVMEQTETSVTLTCKTESILITERIGLDGTSLSVSVDVRNESENDIPHLQIEFFNMFSGGRLPERDGKFTAVVDKEGNPVDILYAESFGERYVKAYDYEENTIIVGDIRDNKWLTIATDKKSEKVTCMVQGNVLTRGFNSEQFALASGDSFTFSQQITVETGKIFDVYPQLRKIEDELSKPHTPSAKPISLESYLTGNPVFKQRWSHLCLQYDYVNPDDIKKLISELFVSLKYTGVVFEFNRGIKTTSHPELAEPWAMPVETAKALIDYAKDQGIEIGIEFNSPGHQNETGIAKVYPELLEQGRGGGATICVSNRKALSIIRDVLTELTEKLEPDLIHLGVDEAQYEGSDTSFGCCDVCRNTHKKPYELFGEYLQWLTGLFSDFSGDLAIWGDMFIQSSKFGPAVTGNGTAGEIYKSLDYLDKKIKIMDWHYFPAEEFKSLDFFKAKGFEVWPVTAFNFDGIRTFLNYAEKNHIDKAMHSTWSVPNQEKFVLQAVVWAGFYQWHGNRADTMDVKGIALDFCRGFW